MRFGLTFSAVLLSAAVALSSNAVAGTVGDLLDRAELRSGAIFSPAGTFIQFVFVPGLNELWELDQTGGLSKRASITVVGDSLYVGPHGDDPRSVWNMLDPMDFKFTGETLPLVGQVGQLLSGTLSQDYMGLPQGSRLDGQFNVIDQTSTVIGHWALDQDQIVIAMPDTEPQSVPITDLLTHFDLKFQGEIN
tara:strand:- start:29 stop:604 length:576 start_codon:yes stop_codon:yes gene_type:complete